jgi:hypothetical protein
MTCREHSYGVPQWNNTCIGSLVDGNEDTTKSQHKGESIQWDKTLISVDRRGKVSGQDG